jgi:hypothetical protein
MILFVDMKFKHDCYYFWTLKVLSAELYHMIKVEPVQTGLIHVMQNNGLIHQIFVFRMMQEKAIALLFCGSVII